MGTEQEPTRRSVAKASAWVLPVAAGTVIAETTGVASKAHAWAAPVVQRLSAAPAATASARCKYADSPQLADLSLSDYSFYVPDGYFPLGSTVSGSFPTRYSVTFRASPATPTVMQERTVTLCLDESVSNPCLRNGNWKSGRILFPDVVSAKLNGKPITFGDWFWDANFDFYVPGFYFTNVKPIVVGAVFELTVTYRTLDSGLGPWQRPPRGCDTGSIAGTLTEDFGAVVYCADEEPPSSLWGWTSSTPRNVYIPAL